MNVRAYQVEELAVAWRYSCPEMRNMSNERIMRDEREKKIDPYGMIGQILLLDGLDEADEWS